MKTYQIDLEGILINDLTSLEELTETAILENLRYRYSKHIIYTFISDILVAINPYTPLDIYNEDYIQQSLPFTTNQRILQNDLPGKRFDNTLKLSSPCASSPHIFQIGKKALESLIKDSFDQAIVISGESGAGKSESTKLILNYVTHATSIELNEKIHEKKDTGIWIETKILEANNILERFGNLILLYFYALMLHEGNAMTIKNSNSSRFGKFIQIFLEKNKHSANLHAKKGDHGTSYVMHGRIIGARITSYLLEKSRVTRHAQGETNYHVFYDFLSDVSVSECETYHLKTVKFYNYLNQSENSISKPCEYISSSYSYNDVKSAFIALGFENNHIDAINRILSAVLWIGNILFSNKSSKDDSAVVTNLYAIEVISSLIGVDKVKFLEIVIYRQLRIRGDVTLVPLSTEKVGIV